MLSFKTNSLLGVASAINSIILSLNQVVILS